MLMLTEHEEKLIQRYYIYPKIAITAVIMALAAVIGAPEIRNKTCLALPFLFLMLHVSYGTGTVIGLIKMPFWAKGIKNGRN